MKQASILLCLLIIPFLMSSCDSAGYRNTFGSDLSFLQDHVEVQVLEAEGGLCQLAIVGDYQGRVMTSTSGGPEGRSYGWINYELIASGSFLDKMNAFGGEDRFWLGPEGGQYSLFFSPGDPFDLNHWQTPAEIDTEPFRILEQDEKSVSYGRRMLLSNYADNSFDIEVKRTVRIYDKSRIEAELGIDLPEELQFVGYGSENSITNTGSEQWTQQNGLLSIWILGMFKPSDEVQMILPYRGELELNTAYFGEIGPDRLQVQDQVVVFKGDGKYRSKIGIAPQNAVPVMGSYDRGRGVLTIVKYSFAGDSTYVNSLWEMHEKPYKGDVVNAYNDGPLEDGDQLGPFYELESSSPARELKSGEKLEHLHQTFHFEGDPELLDLLARKVLGTRLEGLPD